MKIAITTGVFPPDIGGPAEYAKHLSDELVLMGHEVRVVTFSIEKKLPTGLRHIVFFFKAFRAFMSSRVGIAMDTFSVGIPTILAGKFFGRRVVVRIAGDFLWETYVERTGNLITLKNFYEKPPRLSLRDKVVFYLSAKVLRLAYKLVFSTEWQRNIFTAAYNIPREKTEVIANYFPPQESGSAPVVQNFVWATRPMKLKNGRILYRAFADAKKRAPNILLDDGRYPHDVLMERIKSCYAVILPSISDVSPNLINDAIRFGKPFIMTKESGYADLLSGVGIFVDPFDEKALTEAILTLASPEGYTLWQGKVLRFSYTHTYRQMVKEYLACFNTI